MTRALQIAQLALWLAGALLCATLAWSAITVTTAATRVQTSLTAALASIQGASNAVALLSDATEIQVAGSRPQITATLADLQRTAANLAVASGGIDASVAEINRPCGEKKPCGTLADINRTLATFRGTSGQVEAALTHENKQLDNLNLQEKGIADNTTTDLTKLGAAIDSVSAAATAVGVLGANADLAESLKNMKTTTGAVAGMATDTQQYWHGLLHPTWPKKVWNGITGVGIDVGRFFVP